MNFLAPLYLLLAAGAAVPLLLHLMRRNVGTRVEFPAARYLQRAEQEHSRSLRLRNLLLMLLRVLLILLIALAAARPFVRGVGVGHGPTAVAIILDNSLSTTAVSDGAPVFERLRDATVALLRSATPADRVWLVTADGQLRAGTPDALVADVQRLGALQGAGDLALAFRRAVAAVEASDLPARVIAVASDGQQSSWRTAARAAAVVSVHVPTGNPPVNRAVVSAVAEPARWTPRGAIVARVESADSVGYRVLLGERTIARGSAGRGEPIVLRTAPPERGWHDATVEIEPDDFHADDSRTVAVWVGPPPAVSVDPSAGAFASTAVGALVADGRASSGQSVRVVAADEASTLPALITPPTAAIRLGAANRSLARLGVPWRFGPLDRSSAIARGGRLDGVSVSERYRLIREGQTATDTIATAAGEPWVVAGAGYVLIASRLDPAATALPVRAAFVPWLADMIGLRLGAPAGDIGAPREARPGESVRNTGGVDALERAGGGRRSVSGDSFDAPTERGVWFMLRAGRRVGALVVNAPADESVLARWDAGALANRLGGQRGRAAPTANAWLGETFSTGSRRPAIAPLLLLALLLVAAESIAVRTTRLPRINAA